MTQLNKIDENWDLFEHNTKIRTYLKKFGKKNILTLIHFLRTMGCWKKI